MTSICDFCSAPNPGWRYPARSFIGYIACGIAGESVGDWAACEECHRLIDQDRRELLAARSVTRLIAANPEMVEARTELKAELSALHGRFFEHRTGPAEAIV
jgi:hypothetical protein